MQADGRGRGRDHRTRVVVQTHREHEHDRARARVEEDVDLVQLFRRTRGHGIGWLEQLFRIDVLGHDNERAAERRDEADHVVAPALAQRAAREDHTERERHEGDVGA